MAILPDSCENTPIEEYKPAGGTESVPEYKATPVEAGPKRLTIEQYKQRLAKKAEEKLTRIPVTEKPRHRRGGKLVRMRRRIAVLKAVLNTDPPPAWQRASEMWAEIGAIEQQMAAHRNK